MSVAPFSSVEYCSSEGFCSLKGSVQPTLLPKNAKELVQRVDRILTRNVLCPHTIGQLLLLHRNIEQIERENSSISQGQALSSVLIEKVQSTIKSLLAEPWPSRDMINLYYLSQFPPIAPSGISIVEPVLRKVRARELLQGSFDAQLPYCLSKKQFLRDLQLLMDLGQGGKVETRPQSAKTLELAHLRERRLLFLKQRGAADYPPYLDQILQGGFTHLYSYLLDSIERGEESEYRKEIQEFDSSRLGHIVLDVRHAIVEHVKERMGWYPYLSEVVLLVGNTGSGKSTTAALLRGEQLKRERDRYEVAGQSEIGHNLSASCTFLPNVHANQSGFYCVDFPGFNDTRGDLINLGIELAFKALVNRCKPKIVIVESIKALEPSRGTHVADLGERLKRMLGESPPCSVFLTQYLHLAEYTRLSATLKEKKELEVRITHSEEAVSRREKTIEELEQKLLIAAGRDSKKIDKCKEKIQELKQDIEDLEAKKCQNSLSRFEEKMLVSSLKNLPKQEKKLQRLNQSALSFSEERLIKEQIQKERGKNERDRKKILVNLVKLRLCKERIVRDQEGIKEKSQQLLSLMGIGREGLCVAELRDLEDPAVLGVCKEVLDRTKPIGKTHKRLSVSSRNQLLKALKQAFTGRRMPPPPPLEIDDLQQRILETSLTAVLTAEYFPEIRDFLHLPEMETECVKELDLHIVDQFSDALVRLIVVGSPGKEPKEDVIKNFIEKQITNLSRDQEEEVARLQEKWRKLKERVLLNSRGVAVDWAGLEQHYSALLASTLEGISERRKQNLEDWDRWTAITFGVEDVVRPKFLRADRTRSSANQLAIGEIDEVIESLNHSFDKIRELRKIIEHKKEIEEQRQRCAGAVESSASFLEEIQGAVTQTWRIYNKGAKPGETWEDRREKVGTILQTKARDFYSMLRKNSCLVDLMRAELCTQARSNSTFINQLFEKALKEERIAGNFLRVVIEAETRSSGKHLNALLPLVRREAVSADPRLSELLKLAELAELFALVERAELNKRATRAVLAALAALKERAGLADRAIRAAQSVRAESAELAELVERVKRAAMAEPTDWVKLGKRVERFVQAERAARAVLTERASLTERAELVEQAVLKERTALQERAALAVQLERLETKKLLNIKKEMAKAVGAEVTKAIVEVEQLLDLKNNFEEENFLNRVRNVNKELAKRAGLNLDTSLHRILLLDFLSRSPAATGSGEARA